MKSVSEKLQAHKAVHDFKKSLTIIRCDDIWAATNTQVFVRINVAREPIMEAIFWRQ